MFAEINIRGDHIVAIAMFALVFLPAIIFAFRIIKSKGNIPQWLNISEKDFKEKVKTIVQEELKNESDSMKAKDL